VSYVELITGTSGKLGRALAPLYPNALKPTSTELNIVNQTADEEYIKTHMAAPDSNLLIHLAAMTSPPRCEENPSRAWDINVFGTLRLLKACKKYAPDTFFVLMSTACVFAGDDETPKHENSIPYPDNIYGLTKMIQELAVATSDLKYLIIRGNFVPKEKWPYPAAFTDRKSNYLFAHQLAKGMKEAIDHYYETESQGDIVHILGDKILSMYELAHKCPDSENVLPITYEEYYKQNPKAVKLTKSMVLESTQWKKYSIEEG